MARPPSSITRTGSTEPFELQVARGQISWHESISIFGYNGDLDAALETVWPHGGILTSPAVALRMSVSSASADDTALGTGARTVFVEGLDENHSAISEVVALAGQTAVLTVQSFLHINQCYVATAGSLESAAGTIYFGTGTVTAGVPATVYDVIEFDYNIRLTGSYTVPAGYTAYVSQGQFAIGQAGGSNPVTGRLVVRTADNIRRTIAIVTINNGVADYAFEYPVPVQEKSTIEAQAVGTTTNNFCSTLFVMVLIKNDAGVP